MIETYHIGKYVKYNIHCVNSIEEIEKRREEKRREEKRRDMF
jgi:hypothetical protein